MFFEVFQAGIKDLFDTKHLSPEDVFGILDPMIEFIESRLDSQRRKRRNSGCGKRRHELI